MFTLSSAISPVASRIVSFPIDPIVASFLLLGTLLAYGAFMLILGLLARSETKSPATQRSRRRDLTSRRPYPALRDHGDAAKNAETRAKAACS